MPLTTRPAAPPLGCLLCRRWQVAPAEAVVVQPEGPRRGHLKRLAPLGLLGGLLGGSGCFSSLVIACSAQQSRGGGGQEAGGGDGVGAVVVVVVHNTGDTAAHKDVGRHHRLFA